MTQHYATNKRKGKVQVLRGTGQSPDWQPVPARPPCGLHHPGRRRSRVERETRGGAASGGGREGTAAPDPESGVTPPSPAHRRRRPPLPALLTRALQVVAGLHGGSLARLRPPGQPPPPFRAAAGVKARLRPIGPGRGSLRRRRPAPARTAGRRVKAGRGLRDGTASPAAPPPP